MEHGDLIQLLLSGVLLGAVLSVAAAEGAEPTAPALRASRFGDGLRRPRSHAPRISRRPRERNMKFERIEPEAVEQLQKPKSTGVWIYSSAPGDSLDCGGGPQGGTGGAALTWAAQLEPSDEGDGDEGEGEGEHWRVYVAGHGTYQAGGNPNQARFIKGAAENSAGRIRVGETQKTAGEMDRWVDEWNKGDGAKEFNVVTNNCQTFARRFAEFLCEGNSNLPDHAGVAASIGDGFLSAAAGIGCFLQYWPNDNVSAEIGKAGAEARVGWAGARLAAEASLAAIHMQTSTGNDIHRRWQPPRSGRGAGGTGLRAGGADARLGGGLGGRLRGRGLRGRRITIATAFITTATTTTTTTTTTTYYFLKRLLLETDPLLMGLHWQHIHA
ncbi:unnamed protein product [Prorocentrum cordatum]|uniref:PPPDE domain-containing protein n=1 Tax=Prorocentrum cordatum TaxID=2364126 RepID=A0ABN9R6F7_9DINO|nr:unnamed protein product [Polarella glacialis]